MNLKRKIVKEHGDKSRPEYKERRTYTPEEDARILVECEGGTGFSKLARSLGRHGSSVGTRYRMLKNGFQQKKHFTPADDKIILDAVIERLHGRRLSEVSITREEWRQVGDRILKNEKGVSLRWTLNLYPMLLQHYSGTLNFRVHVLLANHVKDTYEDFQSIVWNDVASKKEFVGHTVSSLKNRIYSNLKIGAMRKFGLKQDEINPKIVAKHAREVHGEGFRVRRNVIEKQREVLDYFEMKVVNLGISNFI